MSVTLRLEGLSSKASIDDIRRFFFRLDIPQGGVHIIGGSEAIVDVATWDNAYQALQMSGRQIKDSLVKISVISSKQKQHALENGPKVKHSAHGKNGAPEKKSNEGRYARSSVKYFLRLDISEFAPTTSDIRHLFDGVNIRDMVFSKDEKNPGKVVVIILFANKDDASEGYYRYKDSKIIRTRWAGITEWQRHGGKSDYDEDDCLSSTSGSSRRRTHSRSPQRHSRSARKRSRSPQKDARSPLRYSRSPLSQSEEQDSKNREEYHVQLTNLSYRAKRDDVKKLFHNHVQDDHIVFVYDESGRRTREGFVTFTSKEHFRKALTLHKVMFKGHSLSISLISKSDMQKLLSKKVHSNGSYQAYIYLRNFPPDVTKRNVKQFFKDFSLHEDDIFLLLDKDSTFLGDVLVKFSSPNATFRAEKLDGTIFKDKPIPLKVVYEDKLTSFLDSNGLHMISIDLNDCVTQEDDPSEDEVTQENDSCDDESITQDMDTPEEDCTLQKDSTPECVSQADD